MVQVSDSIKYKQPKKQTFVSMLISGASVYTVYIYIYIYIYMFCSHRLTHALFYHKIKYLRNELLLFSTLKGWLIEISLF